MKRGSQSEAAAASELTEHGACTQPRTGIRGSHSEAKGTPGKALAALLVGFSKAKPRALRYGVVGGIDLATPKSGIYPEMCLIRPRSSTPFVNTW